jgi:uncharacterized protein YbbC (DUF1343 family)
VPIRFTPKTSVFKNEECGGVNVIVTDRARFRPVKAGLEIAIALRRLYPAEWEVEKYARLLVNAETLAAVKRAEEPEVITRLWADELSEFRRARARALLYK